MGRRSSSVPPRPQRACVAARYVEMLCRRGGGAWAQQQKRVTRGPRKSSRTLPWESETTSRRSKSAPPGARRSRRIEEQDDSDDDDDEEDSSSEEDAPSSDAVMADDDESTLSSLTSRKKKKKKPSGFSAAIAEALALARDPDHVLALSRMYASAVGQEAGTKESSSEEEVVVRRRRRRPPKPMTLKKSPKKRLDLEATYRAADEEYRDLLAKAASESSRSSRRSKRTPSPATSRRLVEAIGRLARAGDDLRDHLNRSEHAAADRRLRRRRVADKAELTAERLIGESARAELDVARQSAKMERKRAAKSEAKATRMADIAARAAGSNHAFVYNPEAIARKRAALRVLQDFKDVLRTSPNRR